MKKSELRKIIREEIRLLIEMPEWYNKKDGTDIWVTIPHKPDDFPGGINSSPKYLKLTRSLEKNISKWLENKGWGYGPDEKQYKITTHWTDILLSVPNEHLKDALLLLKRNKVEITKKGKIGFWKWKGFPR